MSASESNSGRIVSESSVGSSLSNALGSGDNALQTVSSNHSSAQVPAPQTQAQAHVPEPVFQKPEDVKIVPKSSPDLLIEEKIIKILNSDNAIEALLARLKKSIHTSEELAKYIRKKAVLEQDHEEHQKKISKTTQDILKNSTALKGDSFIQNLDAIVKMDERLAQHTAIYSKQLFTMYEELAALGSTITRKRKSIKENFKRKEKEVTDSINGAEKAKSKYDSLCLELERVRTTDPSKKTFTLKGSKTTTEQEEILQRKIEAADAEYRQRVSTSTGLRNVFLNTFRPNVARELKDLIIEIDIAMSAQLQKYAIKSEELILHKGLTINPMNTSSLPSLKVIASSIDNERDLYQYLIKNVTLASSKSLTPVEYRQHPSISPPFGLSNAKIINRNTQLKNSLPPSRKVSGNESPFTSSPSLSGSTATSFAPASNSNSSRFADSNKNGLSAKPYPESTTSTISGPRPMSVINTDNVPLPPGTSSGFKTFGTPIDKLIEFEGEMVPSIVRQCIYVVDKYGLELEGIYRTSGNQATVNQFKDLIDKDPSNIKLILPNPNSITDSDIYAVASLLKNYFSSLPEALLTNDSSKLFLEYAKIPEPDVRLKKIHQVIYELPDGSYWTLRSLIFHLSKVSSKQDINLMNSRNLGIIWGPTLFPKESFNATDMTYQGKVIEELIIHANDIFEAE